MPDDTIEYRGYTLEAVQHAGMWQVNIYPTAKGQPEPPARKMPAVTTREEAIAEAKRHIDTAISG